VTGKKLKMIFWRLPDQRCKIWCDSDRIRPRHVPHWPQRWGSI